jgi:DNA-binding NtrC family response regulator
LLGVLERKRFRPVGAEHEISTDIRVFSATNRDLRIETNRGSFRADLYFRLAAARIVLPPLRDRPEDVSPLVRHFLREVTGHEDHPLFGESALAALSRQPWSGNVRELRNVVESAIALGELPAAEASPSRRAAASAPDAAIDVYRDARAEALAHFERDYLARLMAACGDNASEAARRGKIDRPYLLSLLRKHGLR